MIVSVTIAISAPAPNNSRTADVPGEMLSARTKPTPVTATVAMATPPHTDRIQPGFRPAASIPAPAGSPTQQPGSKPARPSLSNQQPTATNPPANIKSSTLYVTIDGLNVRKEPGLKGETIAKLALYEPVTFLNKKTEWTQEISLGYEKVTDHWVKIRTQSGKEGWVFGAGVHYYKMKRQGVMK